MYCMELCNWWLFIPFYLHLIAFACYYLQHFSPGGLILLLLIIFLSAGWKLYLQHIFSYSYSTQLRTCAHFDFYAMASISCVWKIWSRGSSLRLKMATMVVVSHLVSRNRAELKWCALVRAVETYSHSCQCSWLLPHVPPCSLFLHSAGNCYFNDFSVIWNIPSILFQVVCLWLKLVDRRYLLISSQGSIRIWEEEVGRWRGGCSLQATQRAGIWDGNKRKRLAYLRTT